MVFVFLVFLSAVIYSTFAAKSYTFGTFNVGLFPNVPYRDEKLNESISEIEKDGNLDVLCLQQVPFKSDVDKYTLQLQTQFPYSYSPVSEWTSSELALPRTPCTNTQQQYFNNPQLKGCMQYVESLVFQSNSELRSIDTMLDFLHSCISPVALDINHPGHSAYLAIAESLQHSECFSCMASSPWLNGEYDDENVSISIYGDDNDPLSISLLNRCSNPVQENYRLSSGWVILSKYPISSVDIISMPSDILQPREYALTEITLKNNEIITYGCGDVFSSYPFSYEPTLPFLSFDLEIMGIYQYFHYNGVAAASLDLIEDLIGTNNNDTKVLTGNFNIGLDMWSTSAAKWSALYLYNSFITTLDLEDSFDGQITKGQLQCTIPCTICDDNTNYDNLQPSHTPDHIFISKDDFIKVSKNQIIFDDTFEASDGTEHHISNHYGKKTKLKL